MNRYTLAWWNVENLFHTSNYPGRSAKLRKKLREELKGWNEDVMNRKIQRLAGVISKLNGSQGPDLLGLCEVENSAVTQLLVDACELPHRDYKLAYWESHDSRGIDVGFVYDSRVFSVDRMWAVRVELSSHTTRDILHANLRFRDSGKRLAVLANHWPSRRGGQARSEKYRVEAGETLAYWVDRILEVEGDDTAIVVFGDFNDEPFDDSVVQSAKARRTRAELNARRRPEQLLNATWRLMGQDAYTYVFEGRPLMLDQVFVSQGMLAEDAKVRVDLDSVEIPVFDGMLDTRRTPPSPVRFGRPSHHKGANFAGFSDHLPLTIEVEA